MLAKSRSPKESEAQNCAHIMLLVEVDMSITRMGDVVARREKHCDSVTHYRAEKFKCRYRRCIGADKYWNVIANINLCARLDEDTGRTRHL